MDDYDVYHPELSGQNHPSLRLKGEGPAVSATSAPIPPTVRDLPAISDPMITLASSPPSNGIALISMLADVVRLIDDELDHLVVTWWLRVHRGDRQAFGAAHALEVEQRRRQSTPSVVVNPALRTLVATRRWWKVRGGRDAGQLVTFR